MIIDRLINLVEDCKDNKVHYYIRTAPTVSGDKEFMNVPVRVEFIDEYNAIIHPINTDYDYSKVLDSTFLDGNWRECPKEVYDFYKEIQDRKVQRENELRQNKQRW